MDLTNHDSRVLLVDDDDAFRTVLVGELRRRGHAVECAADGHEALGQLGTPGIDVVLLDLRLPDLDGIEVLKRIRAQDVAAGVIVLTGHGTIDTAIQAIRLGAYDYLEKPCPIEKVEMAIRKTREHLSLVARQRVLQDGYSPPDLRQQFVGACPAVVQLREAIVRIGNADATALVLGETGVGKDLVARMLHTESARREAPFVVVDCAALHGDLLQSELFGHEKGSFSGADRRKHGLFEVANGGTLFLDEIGETSLEMQAALLRVLETGRFRRVGGTKEIGVDLRIVSATNRDLPLAISQRRFRQDLFFRLSTFTIEVPPLRARRADIPLLVAHFVDRLNRRFERSCRVGDAALSVLVSHGWPGNVRELIHVLEQAVVLCEEECIRPEHLPRLQAPAAARVTPEQDMVTLRELQHRYVLEVLDRVGHNRARAARVLGISERNLYRLIKRYVEADEGKDGHDTMS